MLTVHHYINFTGKECVRSSTVRTAHETSLAQCCPTAVPLRFATSVSQFFLPSWVITPRLISSVYITISRREVHYPYPFYALCIVSGQFKNGCRFIRQNCHELSLERPPYGSPVVTPERDFHWPHSVPHRSSSAREFSHFIGTFF